jgi:hypothetical protein
LVDKKGFLFTVTVFLVLMYILLTVSVWVKGVETSERAFSEFYKESTVELAIEQITPAKMDNVSYVIMNRALNRLNENAINHPLLEGSGEETANIESALFELLADGSADGSYFVGSGGQITQEENSSLSAWASNLNASLLAIGVYMSDFEVSNFQVGQADYKTVNYSFDINLELKDFSNTSAVTREYHIANEINVTGLVDPALARTTRDAAGDDLTAYRMFFFHDDYETPADISADALSVTVQGGQGFLYGPLAKAYSSADGVDAATAIAPSKRKNYILVGTYDEITDLTDFVYNQFGGFIVTTAPTTTSTFCGTVSDDMFNPVTYSSPPECEEGIGNPRTGKPFIIAPGFNPESAPECPILDGTNQTRRCVLFVNTYLPGEVANDPSKVLVSSGADIYDLELVRDYIMCGYYTHSEKAPSYLQRLLNDSYSRNSTAYGIETFVIGNYANDYGVYDMNSRLDRELLNGSISGVKIRGMPGCRNFASCADSPVTGIFAASDDVITDYGLDDIACDSGEAGCD